MRLISRLTETPFAVVILSVLVSMIALPTSVRCASVDVASIEETIAEITTKVAPTVVQIKTVKKAEVPSVRPEGDRSSRRKPDDRSSKSLDDRGKNLLRRFALPASNSSSETQGSDRAASVKQTSKTAKKTRFGAGIIMSPDGHVLTTSDVIQDAEQIVVTLHDKRAFHTKQRWIDKPTGIAMIKIDAENLPAAVFADSDAIRVGQVVLSIGHPFGLAYTINIGIVTGKGRHTLGIAAYEDFIQTDVPMSPGTAGGPLVSTRGEVIGINAAFASRGRGFQGVSFAIPSNLARHVAEGLANEGMVRRALLGVRIQDLNDALAKSYGRADLNGALVAEVIKGSAADRAGIKKGDIIVEFDGRSVEGAHHLKKLVLFLKPGSQVPLVAERDKKRVTLTATLGGKDAKSVASRVSSPSDRTLNSLGIGVEKLSTAQARDLGLKRSKALRITDVAPDGLGDRMGLRKDDLILSVNGADVATVRSFRDAVARAKGNKTIRLTVRRGNIQFMVASPLD